VIGIVDGGLRLVVMGVSRLGEGSWCLDSRLMLLRQDTERLSRSQKLIGLGIISRYLCIPYLVDGDVVFLIVD